MKYLLMLIVATASLGLANAQGADKQQKNAGCCDGGKCCAKQLACCQKGHK